jgi:SRSO17 transposase
MIAQNGRVSPCVGSSNAGVSMSSQFHEAMQGRTDRANCLPHEKLRVLQARGHHRQKASWTMRRAKVGLKSELRAVRDGALHRAATEVRLSLGSPNILAKRSHLSSFRSLT